MFDFRRQACLPAALLMVLAMTAPAAAEAVAWRHDIRQAAEEAARENKPMLIKVTAVWCGHCKRMQKTFDDRRIADLVNTGFIPVLIDADQSPEFCASIGIEGLPATVVMSPDMKVIEHIRGYRTPKQLDEQIARLSRASTSVAAQQPGPAAHGEYPAVPSAVQTANAAAAGQDVVNAEQTGQQPAVGQQFAAQQVVAQPPAFQGCCLVSLLDEKQLNRGLENHTTVYRGVTLVFASEDYKQRFEADPEKYWPAFDGYCAVSARDFQTSREGLPNLTALYRGRIWLFARPELRRRFISAPQVYAAWAAR